jgi:Predicted transcriptional regulator with C-terminal CBS domains
MLRRLSFGRYVRSRRTKAGLTLRELSLLSGLTSTLIFNLEAGVDPRLNSLERLARAFKESPEQFLRKYYSGK